MNEKRQETQAYKTYVMNYNVMYHDYGMSDKAIEEELGPEPTRFVDELEVFTMAEQANYDATMDAAANRGGY